MATISNHQMLAWLDGRMWYGDLKIAWKQLRIFCQLWEDLSYPEDDIRRTMSDDEIPADVIAERERLESNVVRLAALFAGETPDAAAMFADTPRASTNPYNLERVQLALLHRFHWRI